MAIRIPIDLKRIIDTNKQIIHSLKVQKARQDQMLDKYENELKEELDIPSNRFLPIYRSIVPFLDSVISSKLMDFEMTKQADSFSNELIRYNANFIINEDQINELEDGFDMLVENILELEERFSRLSAEYDHLKSELQNDSKISNIPKPKPIYKCVYCDRLLHTDKEISELICDDCKKNNEKEQESEDNNQEKQNNDKKEEENDDKEENNKYSSKNKEKKPKMTSKPEKTIKPEVRKGFQNLMKDFDRKYRQKIDEEKAKEKERLDYLDDV